MAPVSLITIISVAVKQPRPGQPLKEGPVGPGQVCAGSLAARPFLHMHSGLRQVDGALLELGSTPSLPGHPHPFNHGFQEDSKRLGVSPIN